MVIVGLVLAGAAALVHVLIFWLESLAWTTPRALKTFGLDRAQAEATRELAFNQGFYNLFLALVVALGIVLTCCGAGVAGTALLFAATGSMTAAALVLVVRDRHRAGAAAKQGLLPMLAIVALAVGLAS